MTEKIIAEITVKMEISYEQTSIDRSMKRMTAMPGVEDLARQVENCIGDRTKLPGSGMALQILSVASSMQQ